MLFELSILLAGIGIYVVFVFVQKPQQILENATYVMWAFPQALAFIVWCVGIAMFADKPDTLSALICLAGAALAVGFYALWKCTEPRNPSKGRIVNFSGNIVPWKKRESQDTELHLSF